MFVFLVAILTVSTLLFLSNMNTRWPRDFIGGGGHYIHFNFMLCEERLRFVLSKLRAEAQLKRLRIEFPRMTVQLYFCSLTSWHARHGKS